jgi:hypothetical protein
MAIEAKASGMALAPPTRKKIADRAAICTKTVKSGG